MAVAQDVVVNQQDQATTAKDTTTDNNNNLPEDVEELAAATSNSTTPTSEMILEILPDNRPPATGTTTASHCFRVSIQNVPRVQILRKAIWCSSVKIIAGQKGSSHRYRWCCSTSSV